MSGANYRQYGGNPYGSSSPYDDAGHAEAGHGEPSPYGGQSNPYGGVGGYGASNPYGTNDLAPNAPPLQHENSQYSQTSAYSSHQQPQQGYGNGDAQGFTHGAQPLSQQDFLTRIDGAKVRINQLSGNITEIANIHQRMLSATDNQSSTQLESIITETQVKNTQIKDEIKNLERDASREPQNSLKRTQIESLKRTFRKQLEDFNKEEADYSKRYREAIARQYRIVNPEATESEVQQAANADWGDEGIFQQALKTNRSGQANSVLGAVRARHNDIQRIEKTIGELAVLFQQLDEQVVYQDEPIRQAEIQTDTVNTDSKNANKQLDQGIKSARRARKMKWWVFWIVVLIIAILAAVLGGYFGTHKNN